MWRSAWIPILIVIVDQLTKALAVEHLLGQPGVDITPFFKLVLSYNTGAAFSILDDAGGWQNIFFIAVAVVVCAVIIVMLRGIGQRDRQVSVALLLILGGALGNLIDRIWLGYVVDFLDLYYRDWHWPTFNVADSAISIGAVLLVLDAFGIRILRSRQA
jgi:signal peptidase II